MRKLVLMVGLAVVAFACSEPLGEMLMDGGQAMMDAGNGMMPDAGAQDVSASCNKSANEGATRWAEFPISNPGQTEVTICSGPQPSPTIELYARRNCGRQIAPWIEGTNTGLVWSCDDTTTITVHN